MSDSASTACTAWTPISTAPKDARPPANFPIGVRLACVMTMSLNFMARLLGSVFNKQVGGLQSLWVLQPAGVPVLDGHRCVGTLAPRFTTSALEGPALSERSESKGQVAQLVEQ